MMWKTYVQPYTLADHTGFSFLLMFAIHGLEGAVTIWLVTKVEHTHSIVYSSITFRYTTQPLSYYRTQVLHLSWIPNLDRPDGGNLVLFAFVQVHQCTLYYVFGCAQKVFVQVYLYVPFLFNLQHYLQSCTNNLFTDNRSIPTQNEIFRNFFLYIYSSWVEWSPQLF